MKFTPTERLTRQQTEAICVLWNEEFPKNVGLEGDEFDAFLKTSDGHYHVLALDGNHQIMGWAFSFDRQQERWFTILIHSSCQRRGLGRSLLDHLKEQEEKLCGWAVDHDHDIKKDGQPYLSPIRFYLKNGFSVLTDIRFEDGPISAVKIVWQR